MESHTVSISKEIWKEAKLLGDSGLWALILLVAEKLDKDEIDRKDSWQTLMELPASGLVAKYCMSDCLSPYANNSIFMKRSSFRPFQKVVAKPAFYGSKLWRHGYTMVERNEKYDEYPVEEFIIVFIANVLLFLRFVKGMRSSDHENNERKPVEIVNQYCFVQFFEI